VVRGQRVRSRKSLSIVVPLVTRKTLRKCGWAVAGPSGVALIAGLTWLRAVAMAVWGSFCAAASKLTMVKMEVCELTIF